MPNPKKDRTTLKDPAEKANKEAGRIANILKAKEEYKDCSKLCHVAAKYGITKSSFEGYVKILPNFKNWHPALQIMGQYFALHKFLRRLRKFN